MGQRVIDRNAGQVVGEMWDTQVFQQQQQKKNRKKEFLFVHDRRLVAQQN